MEWLIRDSETQWKVGDIVEFRSDEHLIDRGMVTEIVGMNIYAVELESGPIEAQRAFASTRLKGRREPGSLEQLLRGA